MDGGHALERNELTDTSRGMEFTLDVYILTNTASLDTNSRNAEHSTILPSFYILGEPSESLRHLLRFDIAQKQFPTGTSS